MDVVSTTGQLPLLSLCFYIAADQPWRFLSDKNVLLAESLNLVPSLLEALLSAWLRFSNAGFKFSQ